MRKTLQAKVTHFTNQRLLNVDFHDFLSKSIYMEDTELADEFSLTEREVQAMRAKMQK